jgi:limonene 1,2-monooxygenase
LSRKSFGIFLAPYHCPAGQNPTTAFERDLDVLRLADALGFAEAWIGEHHSCGSELIPDPFLFIAHAVNHVRHLRLGTGVVSLPYHNPLWTAERALFLDHLTRGRFMLGLGPGALPTDATMIGLPLAGKDDPKPLPRCQAETGAVEDYVHQRSERQKDNPNQG